MIQYAAGNLLKADAEALVNTVNCVGVMGKGIALQFKKTFPENNRAYEAACRTKQVRLGSMFVVPTVGLGNPRYIINFPTKNHWKGKSKLADIEIGLRSLVDEITRLGIKSIAIPPLGCGNGGLQWTDVGPLIERAMQQLPDVQALVFPPAEVPASEAIPVQSIHEPLTRARALLIKLIARYHDLEYRLGRLEIQKLAYFLQEAGEAMNLPFVKDAYGPYADNLRFVLQKLDGQYIHGYGDGSGRSLVYLLPGAEDAADELLAGDNEAQARLEQVSDLIAGFETPYGMELLASVHWVAKSQLAASASPEGAVAAVHGWSERKRRVLLERHIRLAWERLRDMDWIGPSPADAEAG